MEDLVLYFCMHGDVRRLSQLLSFPMLEGETMNMDQGSKNAFRVNDVE